MVYEQMEYWAVGVWSSWIFKVLEYQAVKLFKSWNLSSLSIEQLVMEQLEYRTVWNIEQLKY